MRQLRDRYQHGPASDYALLNCAWTGLPGDPDGRCPAHVPAVAALDAWLEEMAAGQPDGLFQFCWGGGQWLAYGTPAGTVRGVYCPIHACTQPDRQTLTANGASAGLNSSL